MNERDFEQLIKEAELKRIQAETEKLEAEKVKIQKEKELSEKESNKPFFRKQTFYVVIGGVLASIPLIWFYWSNAFLPLIEAKQIRLDLKIAETEFDLKELQDSLSILKDEYNLMYVESQKLDSLNNGLKKEYYNLVDEYISLSDSIKTQNEEMRRIIEVRKMIEAERDSLKRAKTRGAGRGPWGSGAWGR